MLNKLQFFILSIFLAGSSVALPGACTATSCEEGLACKNHYEASHFLSFIWTLSSLCSEYHIGACEIIGHSCYCSDLNKHKCEEIRRRNFIKKYRSRRDSKLFTCSENQCLNDGECITDKNNTMFCECKNGFTGAFCEVEENKVVLDYCNRSPCSNNGSCLSHESSYSCTCEKGFFGQNCTEVLHSSKHIATYLSDMAICDMNSCSKKAVDGICNDECNSFACGYDGGDCSAKTNPFEKCKNSEYCSAAYKDGICDQACNNEDCLFDGRDCDLAPSACPHEDYCRKSKNNGICELQCHIVECGYDEDCVAPEDKKMLNGTLDVVIISPSSDFLPKLNDFIYNMTVLLQVSAILKHDKNGPMIFKWRDGATGDRLDISKSYLSHIRGSRPSDNEGVLLSLQIDAASCKHQCFSNIESVADFIGHAVAGKESLIGDLEIYAARRHEEDNETSIWLYIVGLFSIFLFVAGAAIKQFGVWIPPKETEVVNYKPEDEKKPLVPYGQLIIPNSQLYSVNSEVSSAQIQRFRNQSVSLSNNSRYHNTAGLHGNTILHLIIFNSAKSFHEIADDILRMVRSGADLDAQNDLGETALYLACRYQKTQIIVHLLSLGADPSIRSSKNSTPLHQAASNNDLRTIEEMLKYENVRKTINKVDSHDRTPLEVSARHDVLSFQVAERLINSGAHMDHTGEQCDVAVCNGRTALHWAVEASNIQMIKFLVERGSNIDEQDREGQTPLFLASELDKMAVVKILIQMGANHKIWDRGEMVPHDIARLHRWTDIAEFLAALPKKDPPPVIEVTPRITAVRTKKERKRKNSNNISTTRESEATPRQTVKKSKRIAKQQLPLTPPTSDESAANTPVTSREFRGLTTSSQESKSAPVEKDLYDGYSPQGLDSEYIPSYLKEELPKASRINPVSQGNVVSQIEDETASNYADYLNFDDNDKNYTNL